MTGERMIVMAFVVGLAACQDPPPSPADAPTAKVASPAIPPTAQPARAENDRLDCSYPVQAGEMPEAVLARFAGQAQRAALAGPEGTEIEGIILWPEDPARRVELLLDDRAPHRVTGLRIDGGSKWRVAGLRIGDPLGRVTEANGGPFQLYGFAWDYGGYVSDWRGGNLADALSDCQLSVRFSPAANAPVAEAIMGDREISSALPELGPARPRISQLAIAFAQDAGE